MRQGFISLVMVASLVLLMVTSIGCPTPSTQPVDEEKLGELESQILTLRNELSENEKTIHRLEAELAEKSRRIEELETELAELQKPEEEEATPRVEDKVFGVEYHHSRGYRITFDNYAEGKGWRVIRIDVETLTYEYLEQQGVSILYIPAVRLAYTEREIEEIVKFVENGGGLLLVAAEVRPFSDDIARVFGVQISVGWLGSVRKETVQPYHPLARDVGTLQLDPSSYLLIASPPAYYVLQPRFGQPYKPVIAAGEAGAGRFVIYPHYFDLNAADNSHFLRNVLYWLEQMNL